MKSVLTFLLITVTLILSGSVDCMSQTQKSPASKGKKTVRRFTPKDTIPSDLIDSEGRLKEEIIIEGWTPPIPSFKSEPTVWLVDYTPDNFGDFYHPFIQSIKNLDIGSRLRVHSNWDGVYSDRSYSPSEGDIYIQLNATRVHEGFMFTCIYGYRDSCGNWTFEYSTGGDACISNCNYFLESFGYKYGSAVVQYINGRIRR
jgi:hypothetical protein